MVQIMRISIHLKHITAVRSPARPSLWGDDASAWGKATQDEEKTMADADVTRREVLTKAAYMTPAIITLPVLLSFASAGSGNRRDAGDHGKHTGWENGKHTGWYKGKHTGWENG
jgi:hypothetical protein